ncbi:uncharacterized protein LOC141643872 isoform X2 [Silene latifolia]|uniref:uncharacterized protein LOC141643872 isoform X2 n=1 Tax=Silene latifolia TaxID=37657 RepID=UPI003D774325
MLGRNNMFNIIRSRRSCQLPLYVIVLGLIVALALLIITLDGPGNTVIEESIRNNGTQGLESSVLPLPTMEFINGREIIWQIPTNPIAVLFIAHGCGGTSLNFWDQGSTCPKCVGFPEENRIVQFALAQNFGVLTITSSDNCWSSENERLRVGEIIKWWIRKNSLVNVPLFGLGASAGGYFLSRLATEVRFRAIVLMISSGLFDRMNIPHDYPPTLFVHMPKDIMRAERVERHIELLRKKGIETKEIKCMEFPLTASWLVDRVSGLDKPTSTKLLKLFQDKTFIDEQGFMREDGRTTPWKQALKQSNILLPFGSKLMNDIQEELNLAYGYHEMTSLQSDQIFEWLKSHIS